MIRTGDGEEFYSSQRAAEHEESLSGFPGMLPDVPTSWPTAATGAGDHADVEMNP